MDEAELMNGKMRQQIAKMGKMEVKVRKLNT